MRRLYVSTVSVTLIRACDSRAAGMTATQAGSDGDGSSAPALTLRQRRLRSLDGKRQTPG